MNERARNISVGATTVLGLAGLMTLLLLFGYVPRFLQGGYFVTIELDDAASLNSGSRVELSGIDIGRVESIDFRQPYGVTVRTRIEEDVRIPANAEAVVEKPLLGGSPKIKFVIRDPVGDPPKDFLPQNGDAVVTGSLGALAGVFGEIERLATSVEALSSEWQGVGAKVNTMLATQNLDDVEAGRVAGNVNTLISRADLRLREFRDVLQGIDKLVNDPQLAEDVKATSTNLRRVSGDLREASGEFSSSLDALQKRYIALADDISKVAQHLARAAESANDKQGSVGRLLHDPALYENLNDAAERIGTAADELKLLIEKWKAEGVPVNL